VKKIGQHNSSLFISAMKTAKLTCLLCLICWPNHLSAFVEVVEGPEISNFPFYLKVHFSLNFYSNSWSN
jgi:hypothetical protein